MYVLICMLYIYTKCMLSMYVRIHIYFTCAGVLIKSKHVLPIHVLKTFYFSIIQSRQKNCILKWGFDYYRIENCKRDLWG